MTISAASRRQTLVWLSAFCAVSTVTCSQAGAQDYKPGDPIKFGGVHRPMYGAGGTASTGASYTAAPSAPSYSDQGSRSLSPVTSAPQSSFNPANFIAQPVSPPAASLGSGGSPSGYSAAPSGALPPGELPPAPGTRPAYGNPPGGQSFSQAPTPASTKHQHQPHQHAPKQPKQPKPTPVASQQSGSTGGGDGGFWKAMAKPFQWVGSWFK